MRVWQNNHGGSSVPCGMGKDSAAALSLPMPESNVRWGDKMYPLCVPVRVRAPFCSKVQSTNSLLHRRICIHLSSKSVPRSVI